MKISGVRGVLLEEFVLYLLEKVGYRVVKPGEDGTFPGASGLEIQGRGEWHQIDSVAAYDYTPAFMFPIRLLVEAKCYAGKFPVGIEVVRNAVGVHKDISENYFTYGSPTDAKDTFKVQRFNYQSAIFSTSGYTRGAERYAIAHQIFLIQYDRVRLFQPVTEGLLTLRDGHLASTLLHAKHGTNVSHRLREFVRAVLRDEEPDASTLFTDEGLVHLMMTVINPLKEIHGSYFGMLQGKWPMHFLSKRELPWQLFENADDVQCRVYGKDSPNWSFVPLGMKRDDPRWFELQFDLPPEIGELVQRARGDALEIAEIKQGNFSNISLAGLIGGVRRQVMLRLDEEWIAGYMERARMAK